MAYKKFEVLVRPNEHIFNYYIINPNDKVIARCNTKEHAKALAAILNHTIPMENILNG